MAAATCWGSLLTLPRLPQTLILTLKTAQALCCAGCEDDEAVVEWLVRAHGVQGFRVLLRRL